MPSSRNQAGALRVDTYRASGAGGQHVNKTDSAVRITHLPTGIIVSCQSERTQISNRETCMKMLRAKLYEKELMERESKLKEIAGEKKEIAWGSQIRNYVFQPYTLVKDTRTKYEVGNIQAVMDGEIDEFINAYLRNSVDMQSKCKEKCQASISVIAISPMVLS